MLRIRVRWSFKTLARADARVGGRSDPVVDDRHNFRCWASVCSMASSEMRQLGLAPVLGVVVFFVGRFEGGAAIVALPHDPEHLLAERIGLGRDELVQRLVRYWGNEMTGAQLPLGGVVAR